MNILIAEDERITRRLLVRTAESLGHNCIQAEDGQQAWDIFQQSEIDIVISDWWMPRMDGVELCQAIRKYDREHSRYTYFIFVTVLREKSQFLRAMEAGADNYLTKPMEPIDLEVAVAVGTRIMSLHQELREKCDECLRLRETAG